MKPLPALLWGVATTHSPSPGGPLDSPPQASPPPVQTSPPARHLCLGHVRCGSPAFKVPSPRGFRAFPQMAATLLGGQGHQDQGCGCGDPAGGQGRRGQGCGSGRIPPWSASKAGRASALHEHPLGTDATPATGPAPAQHNSCPAVSALGQQELCFRGEAQPPAPCLPEKP